MDISTPQTPRPIAAGSILIEAQRRFASAEVSVNHLDLAETCQHTLAPRDAYRLDLSLTPRLPSRMRFQRWAPARYEQPGRVFVVPPGESLAVWNARGRETVVICHIFTAAMSRWLAAEADFGISARPLDLSTNLDNAAIRQLMLGLTNEVRNPGFASELMVESLVMQLAVELQRHFLCAPLPPLSGGLAAWRLRRIEDRVMSLDSPPSLGELAELCGLSVRQLARGFRASRGQPLGQYVAEQRMAKARQYLAEDRSIKEIAWQLGFASSAAFSHAFRKATGSTPSAYRQQQRAAT